MESSIYVAAAAQRNINKQLTIVANNIANMNTVGFRSENIDFKSIVSRTSQDDVHFPVVAQLYPASSQGSLLETGNPLDIALSGDGWFSIMIPTGPAYTRDGRLQISPFGELQTLEGHPVLDSGGAPIQLDPKSGPPEIHQDGRIFSNGRLVGNIGVFEVPPENLVSRYSNAAFISSVPGLPITLGTGNSITQGFVEQSNVDPIKELANLIAITKTFQNASALVDKVDETLSKSINELSG